MSLVDRLSAFFLAALAVVLLATTAAMYGLAYRHLHRQLVGRLETALDTLEAAVDVEPDGLEWEPADRHIMLGTGPGPDQVRWAVGDGRGQAVDRSANAPEAGFPPPRRPDVAPPEAPGDATTTADVPGWHLAGRRLRLGELLRAGRGHPEDDSPDDDVEYAELTLIVGLDPAPVRATLRGLAAALGGTAAATWLLCALMGRHLVRRALAPLTRMAEAARRLDPDDPGWSLPAPGSGDELDALAAAYNDLLARLRAAFEAQSRFAGEASHQLRSPLAGLLGQLGVALRRERSADEYRRVLVLAADEAARLRRITESLLFLARPESDAVPPEGMALDLSRWLPEQLARWASNHRSSDLRLEPAPGAELVVRAHPELLSQLLDNLIDNALKYSEPGCPVHVSARHECHDVILSVADRGPGLSHAELEQVFAPFYRSETARQRGRSGVGLGLSVARRIATSLGGSLSASSEPGQGSCFTLRLPRKRAGAETRNEPAASDGPPAGRVLIS